MRPKPVHSDLDETPSSSALVEQHRTDVRPISAAYVYLGIFLLALLVRGIYLLELWDSQLVRVLVVDARKYDAWACQIAAGNWFGDEVFYQAPFYPYFLAVIYSIFGHDVQLVRVTQVLLGSASCVMLAAAGHRFFSFRVGIIAGAVLALYAPAIFFDALIQKAALAMFFTSCLLFLLSRMLVRVSWWWPLLAGAVLGCFALTRENSLVFLPVVVIWLLIHFRKTSWLRRIGLVGACAVGMAVVLIPVGLRNKAIGGEFLITTSQLGPNFYIGNNIEADGRTAPMRPRRDDPEYERRDAIEIAEAELGRDLTPAEVSDYWLDRSLTYIRENPGHWIRLLLKKCYLLCNAVEIIDAESIEAYRDSSKLLNVLGGTTHFGVLLPVAVVGIWATRQEWRRLWLVYLLGLAMAGAIVIFFVNARYRMAMAIVLTLFAGAGLLKIFHFLRGRQFRPLLACVAILAVTGALANSSAAPQAEYKATTLTNVAIALLAQGNLDDARENFEQALELVPVLEAAHCGLGDVANAKGNPEEAIAHYQKALELKPAYIAARYHLATTLEELGRQEEAIGHYQMLLTAYPDFADGHFSFGNTLRKVGEYDLAERAYAKAIELQPDYTDAYFNLALLNALRGRLDEATVNLHEVIRLQPDNVEAHRHLGRVLAQAGDAAGATAHLQTAIQLDPNNADAHADLGRVLAALRQAEQAVREFETALEIEPNHAAARAGLERLQGVNRDTSGDER